jgi:NAD(P)-dependent dehydrogenase (short-subunit alcohol dehydrogenase family)
MVLISILGNTGLGYATAIALATHGATIILLCRNAERAVTAITDIKLKVKSDDANITFVPCDLSSLASVRAAAASILKHTRRLNILMCNAGLMSFSSPGLTKDGYEIHLGTNHLGHALLIKLLLPLLEETSASGGDARIVSLTSTMVNYYAPKAGINFEDLKTDQRALSVEQRYAQSKLANTLYVRELAKRYKDIMIVAIHPGLVETGMSTGPLQGSWGDYLWTVVFNNIARVCWRLFGVGMKGVDEGARNQIWGAVADRSEMRSGEYYEPVGIGGKGCALMRDDELAGSLWEWTQVQMGES